MADSTTLPTDPSKKEGKRPDHPEIRQWKELNLQHKKTKISAISFRIQSLLTIREGMIAANQRAAFYKADPPYSDKSFFDISTSIDEWVNKIEQMNEEPLPPAPSLHFTSVKRMTAKKPWTKPEEGQGPSPEKKKGYAGKNYDPNYHLRFVREGAPPPKPAEIIAPPVKRGEELPEVPKIADPEIVPQVDTKLKRNVVSDTFKPKLKGLKKS